MTGFGFADLLISKEGDLIVLTATNVSGRQQHKLYLTPEEAAKLIKDLTKMVVEDYNATRS